MQPKGYCYLCGAKLSKGVMKRHILQNHVKEDSTSCALVLVESGCYWLYAAAPLNCTLRDMDQFLRNIWLECCNHLSIFRIRNDIFELSKSTPWTNVAPGTPLVYEYDFVSTTECMLTVLDGISLPFEQLDLLARNIPLGHTCRKCGEPAQLICVDQICEGSPFFCKTCFKEKPDDPWDMVLPVVNSPRMGICEYEGRLDRYNSPSGTREPPKKITRRRKRRTAPPETPS